MKDIYHIAVIETYSGVVWLLSKGEQLLQWQKTAFEELNDIPINTLQVYNHINLISLQNV